MVIQMKPVEPSHRRPSDTPRILRAIRKGLFRHGRRDPTASVNREANSFLGTIIDRAAEGLCVCHEIPDYPFVRFTVWNPRMTEITGYTMEEINRLGWYQTVYPDPGVRERAAGRMARMRKGTDLDAEEWEICRADGQRRILSICTSALETGDGLDHILALMHDITDRKAAEAALRESEGRYRSLFDNNHTVMLLIDPETGAIIDANPAACAYYGYDRKTLQEMAVTDLNVLARDEVFVEMARAQSENRDHFLFQHRLAGGEVRDVEVFSGPIRVDNRQLLYSIIHDITERRRAEKALTASEREKAAVLDTMSEIVTYQDPNFHIIWANRGAAEYVGVDRETLAEKHCHEVMCHTDGICNACPVKAVVESRTIQEGEVVDRQGDRILYVLGYPVFDEEGLLTGIVSVARDVTEKRRKEEADFKAKKLESIGILAGGIAHDFNNVLTAVLGNINLAQMSANGGGRLMETLEKAEAACLRAKDLSQKLITFAKGGEPVKRKNSVVSLLRKVLDSAVPGPRFRYHLTHGEDLYEVAFDEGQMQQAIGNIITNAVEAMPGGGTVRVHVENVTVADALSSLISNGRHLKITIQDEGRGIAEAELEKIFDPYYTTKSLGTQKGMGLGLSITHSIVTKHHGHIAVESTPGKGTVVCIYLPVERSVPERFDTPLIADRGLKRDRVLIMDDEAMVLDVAGEMLGRLGYDVERALSGEEAIKRYASAIAIGEPFDAVILDLTVKGGMGARETMDHLLRIDPEVVAFLSSGYAEDPAVEDFESHGFSGVIKKPYSVNVLARSLAEGMG